MQTFGEQLSAARKAKGMTQEALASAAAVTRQTISSWERGRTLPDIDSTRRLSDILGIDLTQSAAPADQTAAEGQAASVAEHTVPSGNQSAPITGKRRIRKWQIAAGAAVLACVVLVCFLLYPRGNAPRIDTAYYTQETPNEPGKPYLTFSHKTWIENNGGSDYQMYDFTLTEKNGVAFSITRLETQGEAHGGVIKETKMSAEDLATTINPDIAAYGDVTIMGGFPKGAFDRIGIAVYGNDANGEPIAFYHLIEF